MKAIDISRPSTPKLASVLQNPDNTSAEDIVVEHVRTKHFEGDLAVTGIQACKKELPVPRGLLFFDVSKPYKPKELGSWEAPAGTRGCHEIDMTVTSRGGRPGGVLVACANSRAAAEVGADEVVIVDAGDPNSPEQVGDFTFEQNAGPTSRCEFGCLPLSFAHSVRFFEAGRRLYVSYWDAGTVLLDDPARPESIGVTRLGRHSEDGDNHSMTLADGGRLLLVNSEDVSPTPEVFLKGLGVPTSRRRSMGSAEHLRQQQPIPNQIPRLLRHPQGDRACPRRHLHGAQHRDRPDGSGFSLVVLRRAALDRPFQSREAHRGGALSPTEDERPRGALPPSPFVWGVWPDRNNDVILVSDINRGPMNPHANRARGLLRFIPTTGG